MGAGSGTGLSAAAPQRPRGSRAGTRRRAAWGRRGVRASLAHARGGGDRRHFGRRPCWRVCGGCPAPPPYRAPRRPCRPTAARQSGVGGRAPRPPQGPIRAAALPRRGWAGARSGRPATSSGCCRRRAARRAAAAAPPAAGRSRAAPARKASIAAGRAAVAARIRRPADAEVGCGAAAAGSLSLAFSCAPCRVAPRSSRSEPW